ncbi:response regulator [bacterium]|nr:response regulator [bacterium]
MSEGELDDLSGNGRLVLLVEDDERVSESVSLYLRRYGYEIRIAYDAEEALNLVLEDNVRPDMLITDAVLPGMSGMELVEKLEQTDIQVPVLITSGYTAAEILQQDVIEKGIPFIRKPFKPRELLKIMKTILP